MILCSSSWLKGFLLHSWGQTRLIEKSFRCYSNPTYKQRVSFCCVCEFWYAISLKCSCWIPKTTHFLIDDSHSLSRSLTRAGVVLWLEVCGVLRTLLANGGVLIFFFSKSVNFQLPLFVTSCPVSQTQVRQPSIKFYMEWDENHIYLMMLKTRRSYKVCHR